MLPSSKRPPRHQEEVIRTGDFEVIHAAPGSKGSPRVTERPRANQEPVNDDDQTLLFSGSPRSMLPPRSAASAAVPSMRAPRVPEVNLRGLVREGREKPAVQERTNLRGSVRPRPDNEDRTILRPTSTIPPASKIATKPASHSQPPPAPRASARPPAMMPTPYQPNQPMKPSMKPSAPPVAVSINAPGGSDQRAPAPSNPHEDPPSAVITARTRITSARSRMSWAAGLVALGAVVGLIAAVVVRGDADSVIDATASFVDPSHGMPERANGAAAQAAVLPAFMDTSKAAPAGTDKNPAPGACLEVGESTVSAPVVMNTPPAAPKTASIPGADPTTATRPTPPRPAPVAYAAPRAARAPAAPAPAAAPASTSGGWLANITPAGAGGPIARPSKAAAAKSSGNDFEGAQAADALAKAQLEASLR
jgi:hypothetical protein